MRAGLVTIGSVAIAVGLASGLNACGGDDGGAATTGGSGGKLDAGKEAGVGGSTNTGGVTSTGGSGPTGGTSGSGGSTDAGTDSSVDAPSCTFPSGSTTAARVHIVYLTPTDRPEKANYTSTLVKTIRDLQLWYASHTDNGTTFEVNEPPVQVIATSHDATWYSTHATGGEAYLTFWDNVLADAFPLSGGKFDDPANIWLYYIDADGACGQVAGSGTSGVAVLPANDLRGLTGQQNIPPCSSEPPDNNPRCRWVGGLGHELGHAFGLPHPPGCDDSQPTCDSEALMWLGYVSYPNAQLRADEQQILTQSAFFAPRNLPSCAIDCTKP